MSENIAVTNDLSVKDASSILDISATETNPQLVLSNFKQMWDDNPTKENLVLAKHTVVRHLVSEQMRTKRFFSITSPFENSCISCRGTGEIYKFDNKTVDVNCHVCAGSGHTEETTECDKCDGTGRFIKRWSGGGGMNIQCTKCKGTGKQPVKCSNCLGRGKIKKVVRLHTLKSTTPCRHCKELGFVVPNPIKAAPRPKRQTPKIATPVLSIELANALSDLIKS